MVTVSWHEIVSWAITLVSLTLLLRQREENTKYYMILQGILKACHKRAGFLANIHGDVQRGGGRNIPHEEYTTFINGEYVNCLQLQEHIMGSMKSLKPKEDMPFDVNDVIQGTER